MNRLAFPSPKESRITPIRDLFFQWLSVYVLLSIVVSLIVSFVFETHSARREYRQIVVSKIDEAYQQSCQAQTTQMLLKNKTEEIATNQAQVVAQLLQNDSSVSDVKALEKKIEELAELLKVEEIDVADENGIILASYPQGYEGFDFKKHESTIEFMDIVSGSRDVVVQNIRENANQPDDGSYLYVAVKRLDAPGVVEIGVKEEAIKNIYSLGSVSNFVTAAMTSNGFFTVYRDGALVAGSEETLEIPCSQIPIDRVFLPKIQQRAYFAYAQERGDFLYVGAVPLKEVFNSRRLTLLASVVVYFFIFLTIFLALSFLIKHLIVDNVCKINRSLEKITDGYLDERVSVESSKEFTELSDGVNKTVDALKNALKETKQRADDELKLARRIQAAALPDFTKLFNNENRFEVVAANKPMRQVGGDMYDFFFTDESNVVFYVADVSGHGVAAALVMMKTMALMKNLALSNNTLAYAVEKSNRYLAENNELMFVTGFFCSLNLKTGVLTYVNAGHNPPFLRKNGRKFEMLDPKVNLILGVEEEATFESAQFQLEYGDTLVLYTDGITEATAPGMDCFEVERTLQTLNRHPATERVSVLALDLFAEIDKFTNNADPSDDETLLILKYLDYPKKSST